MIKSFQNEETEAVYERKAGRRFRSIERVALRKLVRIDSALKLADLREPPGNRLEALQGDRSGQFSIRVNDRWRICFRREGEDAYEVEIADYH